MILGLTGEAGAGKDTVADILETEHGFTRYAFGDIMRQIIETIDPIVIHPNGYRMRYTNAVEVCGYDYVKRSMDGRRLIERAGDVVYMLGGPDAVIGYLSRRIIARPAFSRIVITDVRFDNEAAMIRRECGHIAQVVRHDNPHRSTSTHPSNRVIELPDAVIYNNGTKDDLANEVDALLRIHWRKP